ncbi:MAG: SGNH/GDSL hydrolase family protein [Gemmatimonadota bacterium]
MRVLFVSNSQGTSAGLEGELRWSSYPLLVQDAMPGIECRYWTLSELTVGTVDSQFREIVMPHRPDAVILQCGIIESALRILPRNLRDLFRIVPGGRFVTRALHERQAAWRRFLDRRGIRFLDMRLDAFLAHVRSINGKCGSLGTKLAVVRIPLLSERCERELLPGNNAIIREWNRALDGLCRAEGIPCVDPFDGAGDPSRDTLFLAETVHFSERGHRVIAGNVADFIRRTFGSTGAGREAPPAGA